MFTHDDTSSVSSRPAKVSRATSMSPDGVRARERDVHEGPVGIDSAQAWRVAVASAVVVGVAFGTVYTFGTFFDAMAAEFDAGLGPTSLVFGITMFLFFGAGAATGFLADRWGATTACVGRGSVLRRRPLRHLPRHRTVAGVSHVRLGRGARCRRLHRPAVRGCRRLVQPLPGRRPGPRRHRQRVGHAHAAAAIGAADRHPRLASDLRDPGRRHGCGVPGGRRARSTGPPAWRRRERQSTCERCCTPGPFAGWPRRDFCSRHR